MLREDIERLETRDLYSIILFTIFQLNKTPEYSVLSELIYTLDKDNLLKLCDTFGGMTIRIPKKSELETLTKALLLYMYVELENMPYEDTLSLVASDEDNQRQIREVYSTLVEVMSNYEFGKSKR